MRCDDAPVDADNDPKELVRRGYDVLSSRYDEAFGAETKYAAWLTELCDHIREGGVVLDIGCGSGLPVGVDVSAGQIDRARRLVPDAEFIQSDAAAVEFAAGSFDAVVCFYALIHMPLDEQFALLNKISTWLRPGGWFVGTTGHTAWTGIDENWLGGGAAMWWSHADAGTYRDWLVRAGLTITREEFVPEGAGGHTLFWTAAD